jgi:DNA replication protein DnaC
MSESTTMPESTTPLSDVEPHLTYLKLSFIAAQYAELATHAAHKAWSHVDYLARLVEGEADLRRDRATKSRIRLAASPASKPWSSSAGPGPPGSTASKCKTTSTSS